MAYGVVPAPMKAQALDIRLYRIPERAATEQAAAVVAIPFDMVKESVPTELETRLREVFNDELAKGVTYPQRGPMDETEFRSYFLSYDLIVGVLVNKEEAEKLVGRTLTETDDDVEIAASARRDILTARDWHVGYAFSYYIKVSARVKNFALECSQIL